MTNNPTIYGVSREQIPKFRALGQMDQRSRKGGAEYVRLSDYDALQSTIAQLQARIGELELDKDRLDALDSNCWDVRFGSTTNGDAGDSSINIEVVGHWMDKPFERVIGENYSENLRAAIDQAMTAPAYPPERPEYPEIEACLNATASLNTPKPAEWHDVAGDDEGLVS